MFVQPHGVLLALAEHDLAIVMASRNTRELLRSEPERVLGAPLASVLVEPSERELRDILTRAELGDASPLHAVAASGARLDGRLHRSGGLLVIELEPAGVRVPTGRIVRAVERLQDIALGAELARATLEEICTVTGFSHAAIFRCRGQAGFEAVASVPAQQPPPVPIPLAAGESMRFIADRAAPRVAIVAAPALVDAELDLSHSALRADASSEQPGAAFVLRLGDWGVIACEHPSPLHVSWSARLAAQVIAATYAGHIAAHDRLGDELRASNMAKDEFLATVSHELRTPLNAMLGWLRLIEAGQVAPDRHAQAIATVTRNAHALAQLVEELLDVSRIITGKMPLDLRPVAPAGVIEAAIATVQPAADAKGIALATRLEPAAGPVLADAGRLQQIIWNLAANAVKFTPEGGTIEIALRRSGEHIEIAVVDTGIGIAPQLLPYVFDRFRQGDDATTRAHGLGLGLSIVRRLVELHGGDVIAASPGVGRGATFTVRLPLAARAPIGTSPALPVFAPSSQLTGLRVLSVDDERDANDLVRAVLVTCGAEVTTVASASEVLSLLPVLRPHVLMSDIGMPGVDGYELIAAVRAHADHELARTPAVALTAFARSHDRSRAFLAGFDVFLAKPVDPAELVAVLANFAGRRTGSAPRVDDGAAATGPLASTRILVVEDDPDSGEILCELLSTHGAITELARTARDGLDQIRRFRPDVLVSDLSLPDKDGFAFVRELRATGADDGGWIPAIALSGHADADTARAAILAGFQLHVAKPVDPQDLIARLTRLVGRTARRT